MNYKKACAILEIGEQNEEGVDYTHLQTFRYIIKKQYRLKALQYHPDKNHLPDALHKFQEINNAYDFLTHFKGCQGDCQGDSDNDGDGDSDYWAEYEDQIDKNTYKWTLFSFLKNILQPVSKNKLFYIILQRVVNSCESTALDTLNKLDKTTLINIYEILKLYEDAFHFTKEFIHEIEKLINDKVKNDECIILNPTIDDLFEDNLYKLTVNDFVYIVPLWHDELVYDNSGNDIFVKCYPILPENMCIDNKNDIHMNVTYNMIDLWRKENVEILLGYNKKIILNPQLLKLKPNQTVIFAKQGISKINTDAVYDVSKKGDIYLHIQLEV